MPGAWDSDGWGEEWGGDATMQAYFMPPVALKTPPGPVPREADSPRFRHAMRFPTGDGGTVTVAGVEYLGGRWTGPLTTAQMEAIAAAGYRTGIWWTAPDWLGLPGSP